MRRGTRTKMIALSMLACLVACSSGDKRKATSKTVGKSPTGSKSVEPSIDAQPKSYTITATSWGARPGEETRKAPVPPPIIVSWKEGQRQKFERDAPKRWKNTEIYVRRDR